MKKTQTNVWALTFLLPALAGAAPVDDPPTLSAENEALAEDPEAPEGTLKLRLPVRLDAPAGALGVTASFQVVGCSAEEGKDYVLGTPEPVIFAPNTSETWIEVELVSDEKPEGVETFHVHLSEVAGAFAGDLVGEGRILDPTPLAGVTGDIDGNGTSDLWAVYEVPSITQPDVPRKKIVVWGVQGSSAVPFCEQEEAFDVVGAWSAVAVADLDGDGSFDTVWRHVTGELAFGRSLPRPELELCPMLGDPGLPLDEPQGYPSDEDFVGSGRFNLEGGTDLLTWNRTTGALSFRTVGHNLEVGDPVALDTNANVQWHAIGTGDFDGDGWTDVLWRHAVSGNHVIWYFTAPPAPNSGHTVHSGGQFLVPARPVEAGWEKVGVADYNGDGEDDLLLQHTQSGHLSFWFLRQGQRICGGMVDPSRLDDPTPELEGAAWEIIKPR